LQGPHHGAQKSTNTGSLLRVVRALKAAASSTSNGATGDDNSV